VHPPRFGRMSRIETYLHHPGTGEGEERQGLRNQNTGIVCRMIPKYSGGRKTRIGEVRRNVGEDENYPWSRNFTMVRQRMRKSSG